MTATIPVLDVADFLGGRPGALQATARALHDALTSLPLWPYMHIEVVPLARHPNDPAS